MRDLQPGDLPFVARARGGRPVVHLAAARARRARRRCAARGRAVRRAREAAVRGGPGRRGARAAWCATPRSGAGCSARCTDGLRGGGRWRRGRDGLAGPRARPATWSSSLHARRGADAASRSTSTRWSPRAKGSGRHEPRRLRHASTARGRGRHREWLDRLLSSARAWRPCGCPTTGTDRPRAPTASTWWSRWAATARSCGRPSRLRRRLSRCWA